MNKNSFWNIKKEMQKCIDAFIEKISLIHSRRIKPNLFQKILVHYYDKKIELGKISSIVNENENTIVITVFDKNTIQNIKNCIIAENFGVNLSIHENIIKIYAPPISEERRVQSIKKVKKIFEEIKISIRNTRRIAKEKIKKQLKNKEISIDEEKREQKNIQKITDFYTIKLQKEQKNKEKELMK
ncbi:ribosome recycling factor [bacterium endosymbiont of Pedicinus badii]|uniref:ribosome recycling factor n=1 Tax=bacterium endosymbiont of Pedicinus badii TaxID=1719126 RepID=UPI0009BBF057|nr:ribosome recycling factor [bacterium endosymbiont of Pedicinus badii]OQM33998.1 hypothetical protein AOQ89_01390 [bacterium endosymbiont of Pedicinus badii]